jgi:hypothetical protein
MGFFDIVGRIVKGQPAFVVDDQKKAAEPQQMMPQTPLPVGPKVYPQVYIGRVECRQEGANMSLELYIHNHSEGQIELDKIELFGHTQQIDIFLRAGEEREYAAYHGPRPTANNQTNCKIYYKDATGDYFASEHYIEFRQEADRTYSVDRIRLSRVLDV